MNKRNALRSKWQDRDERVGLNSIDRRRARMTWSKKCTIVAMSSYPVCGNEKRIVCTSVQSNPGFSLLNRMKLRNSRPAFASKTSASAICPDTSHVRSRDCKPPPVDPRPLDMSPSRRSDRESSHAGASPHASAAINIRTPANRSTVQSIEKLSIRGRSVGTK